MSRPLIDTNAVLRLLLHPEQSPRSTAYFDRIGSGEVQARLFRLRHLRVGIHTGAVARASKARAREVMAALLGQRSLLVSGRSRWRRVFDLYVEHNIPLGDGMNIEFMERNRLTEIISFDRDFDRVSGITRIEP